MTAEYTLDTRRRALATLAVDMFRDNFKKILKFKIQGVSLTSVWMDLCVCCMQKYKK
jgi:hypothetical protein